MDKAKAAEISFKEPKSGATLFLILLYVIFIQLAPTSQVYTNINIFITQTSSKGTHYFWQWQYDR